MPPTVSVTTQRWYDRLPQLYRDADEAQDDFPLLRYLSLIGDQAGEIEQLHARIDYDDTNPADTSDLADPDTADEAWLPWLAQLVGVPVGDTTGSELRDAIRSASAGWRAGTRGAIADAARSVLSGSKYVLVTPNYTGDPFKVELRLRTSELPAGGTADVLAAIERKRARPAGVLLVATSYEASWDTLAADRPTWDDWDGSTWTEIEETGAP